MNKKLLIVANNAQWKSWPEKIEALKTWFAPRVNLEIGLTHTNHSWIPFEQYGSTGQDGVGRVWYDTFIAPLGQGYDMVLFVVNKSQWNSTHARGWRDNTDFGAVGLQLGADEFEPFWRRLLGIDGEMFHQVARHEILHGLFYLKCGEFVRFDLPPTPGRCIDTTHYHWDRGELEKALIDLIPEEPKVEPAKEILIIHHTATPRDRTSLEVVIADQMKRYGRAFYQCFITPDGKIHWQHKLLNTRTGAKSIDYCLVGDFTTEKPTEAQLDALNVLVGNKKYIGHGEAVIYGATKSECPGNLLKEFEAYKKQLLALQNSINLLMLQIKRIFGLK